MAVAVGNGGKGNLGECGGTRQPNSLASGKFRVRHKKIQMIPVPFIPIVVPPQPGAVEVDG
jgi:hypothetical protein